jgi:hypothetical protein
MERQKPKRSNIQSVSHWLEGSKPLIELESTFLNDWDNLVSPRDLVDHGELDHFIGNCAAVFRKRPFAKVGQKLSLPQDLAADRALLVQLFTRRVRRDENLYLNAYGPP